MWKLIYKVHPLVTSTQQVMRFVELESFCFYFPYIRTKGVLCFDISWMCLFHLDAYRPRCLLSKTLEENPWNEGMSNFQRFHGWGGTSHASAVTLLDLVGIELVRACSSTFESMDFSWQYNKVNSMSSALCQIHRKTGFIVAPPPPQTV